MKVKVHVLVSGRVQGVFFRSETLSEAKRRNITGWVRNTSNGCVEAVFEGEKNDINNMIAFCRRGPSGANVTTLDIQWMTYNEEFEKFKIRYGHQQF